MISWSVVFDYMERRELDSWTSSQELYCAMLPADLDCSWTEVAAIVCTRTPDRKSFPRGPYHVICSSVCRVRKAMEAMS